MGRLCLAWVLVALALSALPVAASADTVWLCNPVSPNPCNGSLQASLITPAGVPTGRTVRPTFDPGAPIDCFYVYPTVSDQPGPLATLDIDQSQRSIALYQAAPFSHVCRVYAPMYRQLTLSAINAPPGTVTAQDQATAYGDVRAAWRDYLRHDNHGRGVVLIGHSQGTGMLTRLMAEEIDGRPSVRRRLVSALLIGGNVLVPAGRDVGGSFQHVPACRTGTQVGCVVAYSSFLQTQPDPSLFSRGSRSAFEANFGLGTRGVDLQRLCVNQAAPGGGSAPLSSFFFDAGAWTTYPGRYRGHCARADGADWLQIDPTPGDPRPVVDGRLGPGWGLHGFDVNLTLGDMVSLVRRQAAAYGRR
jgi:hypothetical protein